MTYLYDSGITTRVILLAILLTIAAAIPRLYNLGEQSFYMDEETTAFASRALLEENNAQMPSGMPYRRALPHTWINSISADIFGLDNEFSYRLPGAIFGIFTIPLVFFLARPYTGTSIAFLAALLLAFSEWHIITSRQARMYAPFLFFYTACAYSILIWAKKDELKFLVITILLFLITLSLHSLSIFAAIIPLSALFIKGYAKTPYYKLITFSIIGIVASYLYGEIYVAAPYQTWKEAHGILSNDTESVNAITQLLITNNLLTAPAIIGAFLGVWLAKSSRFHDTDNGREFRLITRYILAILFGWLSTSVHLHGAFLSILLMMLLYPGPILTYIKQTHKPLIAISALTIITIIATLADLGFVPGLKASLVFPYPNWIILNSISSGITLSFIAAMLYLAIIKHSKCNLGVLVLLIICLIPLILIGIFMKWAAARYLIQAYPFILILSAYAIYVPIDKALKSRDAVTRIPALIPASLIVLSGILGGHGFMSAYKTGTVKHGDQLNEAAMIFPFYPDHKFPGEYVATHRAPDDIVIAEDVLEQRWYAGTINYWLRKYSNNSNSSFMYKGKDKKLHDIYVNSIVATPEILNAITNDKSHRIWIITSGETYYQRDFYLKEEQRQWLENIESTETPVFTGRDKITRVYCLNCDTAN